MKKILALDLGTWTGWAYRDELGAVTAGTWTLMTPSQRGRITKTRLDRRLDPRIPLLHDKILTLHLNTGIDFLVFEDVRFSKFTLQTQLWSSLRGAVWLVADRLKIPTDCLDTASLKKFATGTGNAEKPAMIAAARRYFPGLGTGFDDNAADALHLLRWATTLIDRNE